MAKKRRVKSRKTYMSAPKQRKGGFRKKTNKFLDIDFEGNLMSGVYGNVRQKISNVNPLNNVFGGIGAYSDEIAMFVALQGVKALVGGKLGKAAKIGQYIESAMIGAQFQGLGNSATTNTSNTF